MTAAELRRWLSEEQFKLYCEAKEAIGIFMDSELSKDIIEALESLTECKRVMKKYEECINAGRWGHVCPECNYFPHTPNCAVDRCIAGYPREVKDAE